RQYNLLFSFMVFGYMGSSLITSHALAINGNEFILLMLKVNLIEQELTTVNLFVRSLYQLYDVEYPQAHLIIQQLTNNAACTHNHPFNSCNTGMACANL
ncbi:22848_t:CDS:2, partial [Dentiscutata erythropus]